MNLSLNCDNGVRDLRGAIELLKNIPGQYVQTDVEADPHAEIAGIYRYVGAGGTTMRPTKEGPMLMFNNVKGYSGARVAIGLLASRKRVGYLLGCEPANLGKLLNEAVEHPVAPVEVGPQKALCQQVVHRADEPGFDVRRLVPAPTNTEEDAGPYITMGLCYAVDPETGERNLSIHRMCIQGPDEISIYLVPGSRHLGSFFAKAEAAGKPLPVSISIGVDPAIQIGSCFEPPTTPQGYDEMGVAGALRGEGVELAKCLTIPGKCVARAEYVIEGEILPGVRVAEDQHTHTGKAMPEFPGYTGEAKDAMVIKVTAVTTRQNPIMQSVIGPSEEHVSMAGIPTEASILSMVERAMPGRVLNVYCASSGGGKYMAVIQFKKSMPSDEGRQRQAALLAFSAFSELKNVFLVDEDVDPFDLGDVVWAMNTRCQSDVDIVTIPGVRCHPLDPSQSPAVSPSIRDAGISCKTIFDCTVPYDLKDEFRRAQFKQVDIAHWGLE